MFIQTHKSTILLFIVIAIALFFRLYHITTIPYGLNNDAAWEGSAALDILRGHWQNYLPYAAEGWRGEGIVRAMVAMIIPFTGPTPLAIEIPTILLGIALIIPLYFFIRGLFSESLALVTTFFVATSGWDIIMSKSGWRAISVPLVATIVCLSLWNVHKTKRLFWWFIAGLSLALSLYTYDAGRVILPFAIVISIYYAITHRGYLQKILTSNKQCMLGVWVALATFSLFSFPIVRYAIRNWDNFIGRSDYLFVGHTIASTDSWKPLWDNVIATISLFTFRGNGNDFFVDQPLLNAPTQWLLPIGIVIALWFGVMKKNKKYLFILLWGLTSLIPALASLPNGNRAIGTIPVVYFLAALAALTTAHWVSGLFKLYTKVIYILLVSICALITMAVTYTLYLGPHRLELPGFYPETRVVTDFVKSLPNTYSIYLSDNYPRELLTYYLYRDGDPFKKHYTWIEHPQDFLTIQRAPNEQLLFIMFANDNNEVVARSLLSHYSSAQKTYLWYHNDEIQRKAALVIRVP